jgi:general secretion pathway protein I
MEKWKRKLSQKASILSSGILPSQHSTLPEFHHSNSQSGFSILEVLIALAVFGIAAGGMLSVLSSHMHDVSYLQDQARAMRIARREMDALQRMDTYEDVEDVGEDGRFSWTTRETDQCPVDIPGEEFSDDADSDAEILAYLEVQVSWSETEGGSPSQRVRLQALCEYPEE